MHPGVSAAVAYSRAYPELEITVVDIQEPDVPCVQGEIPKTTVMVTDRK